MCGIVGIVSREPVAPRIVSALKRLEYRGYDSSGIATLESGHLTRRRAEGKLARLEETLQTKPLEGYIGIGHTRWATHGKPTERNAHPHATDVVAVVHNGIIENFRQLRRGLEAEGVNFESDTDTEVVTHLVSRQLRSGLSPRDAVLSILPGLRGAFALVFLFEGDDDLLIGARRGSPLAVGQGRGGAFLGSDALALAPLAETITYLEEGDVAVVHHATVEFLDTSGRTVLRHTQKLATESLLVEKGHYSHFMAKEIHEQPDVIAKTIAAYVDFAGGCLSPIETPFDWRTLEQVTISACGTAYYAGLVAKYWFEKIAGLPVQIDVASEFRYREPPMPKNGLMLLVSQSGETADTLACLRFAKSRSQHVCSVLNVRTSTMARESEMVVPIHAGPEIGVASTKAFTCQLTALLALALHAGSARGTLADRDLARLLDEFAGLPELVREVLLRENEIRAIAAGIVDAATVLYLGRGTSFPLALEGALKLKEISYIHAEGLPAGELKHGPIALIDQRVPVVVLLPTDEVLEKTVSNVQEVAARGGRIILVGDERGVKSSGVDPFARFVMPGVEPIFAPILYAVPLQLMAFHAAVLMGKDVDQPRNLAKSVTVE
jgi:glucosamine--fructose-6-phosphate aminotransferase (isomerizing)